MLKETIASVFMLAVLVAQCEAGSFTAGAGRVVIGGPEDAPLGAFNHGDRRVSTWPVPKLRTYTSFLNPAQSPPLDPLYARALVIFDGTEKFCFVTLDLMCSDGPMQVLAYALAAAKGFSVPESNVIYTGSHTHSGIGGWTTGLILNLAPTMDLFVPEIQEAVARAVADAMVEAEKAMVPAKVGTGETMLYNVTRNRRAKVSPYVNSTSIDPHFGVLRVDAAADNAPIATLYSFAIHGTCHGSSNMQRSADIMGVANNVIETANGGVALFMQSDAGDISPGPGACDDKPRMKGGVTMGQTALNLRAEIQTSQTGELAVASVVHSMGVTNPDWTLARNLNCTKGGPRNICGICEVIGCTIDLGFGRGWTPEVARFNSLRLTVNNRNTVFTSCPFEAIQEFGQWVRNDTTSLGFDQTFFAGYSNGYLYYMCTPREWALVPNGYECSLTIWGENQADQIRSVMYGLNKQVSLQ